MAKKRIKNEYDAFHGLGEHAVLAVHGEIGYEWKRIAKKGSWL